MKKFSFPLQLLLDYREKKEDRLKKELAQIKRRLEKERKNLAQLQLDSMTNMRELKKKHQSEKVEIALILLYYSYLDKLIYQIKKQSEIVVNISREMEEKRKQVIEASRGKKIIEKLKERKWIEFSHYREKTEQNFIDEMALTKFKSKKLS